MNTQRVANALETTCDPAADECHGIKPNHFMQLAIELSTGDDLYETRVNAQLAVAQALTRTADAEELRNELLKESNDMQREQREMQREQLEMLKAARRAREEKERKAAEESERVAKELQEQFDTFLGGLAERLNNNNGVISLS